MESFYIGIFFTRLVFAYTMLQPLWTRESIHGFHYFETVTHINRQSRVRKSTHGGVDAFEYASFKAFNRSFEIVLKPGTDVLAEDFKAYVIEADGQASRLFLNVNDHFNGHLIDDPDVVVDGHMEDTMIVLTIFDHLDTYAIEPSRIYWTDTHSHEVQSWIVYRLSDTYMDGIGMGRNLNGMGNESFCGNRHDPEKDFGKKYSKFGKRFRMKQFPGKYKRRRSQDDDVPDTCPLLVVATNDLFFDRCKRSSFICAQFLISNVVFADFILRETDLGQYTGVRLTVKEMVIFDHSSSGQTLENGFKHFNCDKDFWNYNDLLDSFTKFVLDFYQDFCAAFLFHSHDIIGPVVGLAYIGTTCTALNTGFASTKSHTDNIMSSLRHKLLFVHELGHTFGSKHDTEVEECSSPNNLGGNYIMWPFISDGLCKNCRKYSICSRHMIAKFLDEPHSKVCFKAYKSARKVCGNGVLEEGEQCDEGFYNILERPCCNQKCQLFNGSVCSDHNSACCKNCQIAPKGLLCQGHVKGSCLKASFCKGDSLECPVPEYLDDDEPCRDQGRCYEGICKSYCFYRGRHYNRLFYPCMCDQDVVLGCKVCCYDGTYEDTPGKCIPRGNYNLSDGRPCYMGVCKRGICELSVSKGFKVWAMISDAGNGAKFMKDNIVATIIVVSGILWIPACWTISEIDKKVKKLLQDEVNQEGAVLQLVPTAQSMIRPIRKPHMKVQRFHNISTQRDLGKAEALSPV